MSRNTKFTIDEIKELLKKNFPQISLLKNQTYINRHQELKFSCKLHGEFSKPMIKISRGYHCPSCGKIRQGKKSVKELNDYLKKNLPLISLKKSQTYINNKVKMIFVCKKHGEFETTWNSITRGSNCQKCGIERRKLKRTIPIQEILEKIKLKHNGKIELINPKDYVNSHSKLKFKCEKNHPIWETKVYNILQGKGCPKCAGKNITTNEFISNVKSIHGDSISLANGEIYKGRTKKLKFICNKCNREFFSIPSNIIFNKSGCPNCKGDKLRSHFAFSTDEVIQKIKVKTLGKVIPFENQEYVNQKTIWEFKCDKYPLHPSWKTNVGTILNRKNYVGCRYCLGERPVKTKDDIKERLFERFNKKINLVEVIGDSITLKSKVKVLCKLHDITYTEKLSNVLKSKGCIKCSSESYSNSRRTKSDKLIKQVYEIHRDNLSIVDVNQYVNTDTKIQFKCNLKNHGLFESTPHMVLSGRGCPICNMSKGERKILFWLRDNKIKYEYQHRIKKSKSSKYYFIFDFYLPEKKLFIEFDGRQHFVPIERWGGEKGLKKIQKNDLEKDIISKNMGFKMIRISYLRFDEIEQILRDYII